MIESTKELLGDWYLRLRFAQFAHYEAANKLDYMHYWLGIPAIALSTFVSTSVFANIGKSVEPSIQILVGMISVLAAILASLQTFLRFSERSQKHRVAASKYGALRREIEEMLTIHETIIPDSISQLRQKIDRLAEEAPQVPDSIWSKRQEVLKEDTDRSLGLG